MTLRSRRGDKTPHNATKQRPIRWVIRHMILVGLPVILSAVLPTGTALAADDAPIQPEWCKEHPGYTCLKTDYLAQRRKSVV